MLRKRLTRLPDRALHSYAMRYIGCISDRHICTYNFEESQTCGATITDWKLGSSATIVEPTIDDMWLIADRFMYLSSNIAYMCAFRDSKVVTMAEYPVHADPHSQFIGYSYLNCILWFSTPNMYICSSESGMRRLISGDLKDAIDAHANSHIILIDFEHQIEVMYPRSTTKMYDSEFASVSAGDSRFGTFALNPVRNQYVTGDAQRMQIFDIERTSTSTYECTFGRTPVVAYIDPNVIVTLTYPTVTILDTRTVLPAYDLMLDGCKLIRAAQYTGSMATWCAEYDGGVAIID